MAKASRRSELPQGGREVETSSQFFKFKKPGDWVVGVITGFGSSQYGAYMVLREDDGTSTRVALKNSTLQTAHENGAFVKGHKIGIEFVDTTDSKVPGHKPYKNYRIVEYELGENEETVPF